MIAFTFLPPLLHGLLLFTRGAACADLDPEEAKELFLDLTPMAVAWTTQAAALNPLDCAPIPIIMPESKYDQDHHCTDDLVEDMVDAINALTDSAHVDTGVMDVFLAYYDFSKELRRLLATLDTKSCSTAGMTCSAFPTTRTKIRTSITNLKNAVRHPKSLASALIQYLAAERALAVNGVSEADQLFCQLVVASFGGVLNLG
ncbi:hypothetical protein QBC37DRAFT_370540 [Rhypophila decipiens]|uniref:Uncharacterized protein n=1 Tax=Rhypophila decipiens TaxID=261697 RepID=A0AAN6YD51_9PEZI|nr:hypothetical protein QBC37DRAFT_370540 [Rhypophila decipiens]